MLQGIASSPFFWLLVAAWLLINAEMLGDFRDCGILEVLTKLIDAVLALVCIGIAIVQMVVVGWLR